MAASQDPFGIWFKQRMTDADCDLVRIPCGDTQDHHKPMLAMMEGGDAVIPGMRFLLGTLGLSYKTLDGGARLVEASFDNVVRIGDIVEFGATGNEERARLTATHLDEQYNSTPKNPFMTGRVSQGYKFMSNCDHDVTRHERTLEDIESFAATLERNHKYTPILFAIGNVTHALLEHVRVGETGLAPKLRQLTERGRPILYTDMRIQLDQTDIAPDAALEYAVRTREAMLGGARVYRADAVCMSDDGPVFHFSAAGRPSLRKVMMTGKHTSLP